MQLSQPAVPIIKPIRAGATIGVIAPAGPSPLEKVEAIGPWLARHGLRSRIFPGCRQQLPYLAGPDNVRLADIHAAFVDPQVHAVFCMRGGYGSARLLEGLDFDLLRRHPKPFIGYSDITALHGALSQLAGMTTIHAPMLTSDLMADADGRSFDALLNLLLQGMHTGDRLVSGSADVVTWIPGWALGRLVGGNLAVICSLLGTPWAIDTRDAILFIEDIGEDPYRVDRMLTQLRLAGCLDAAAGFVVGSFSGADDPTDLIAAMLMPYGKPTLAHWPAGHCRPNYPLPIGAQVILDATAQRIVVA